MRTAPPTLLALFVLLMLPACGGGSGTSTPLPTTDVTIFQVDGDTPGIVGIWRPDDGVIDGDIAPASTIGGPTLSGFAAAYGVHHDSRGDTLIVGDTRNPAILFFDAVTALDGDVSPTRTLGGPMSLITVRNAYETFVDEVNDRLYLAHDDGVFVYSNAATLDGDVAPARNITGPMTGLVPGSQDKRLFVDPANNRLFVLDGGTASLLIWDSASTADGDTPPSRVVAGANTNFDFPWGLAVDVTRDIVYVADENADAVFVFDSASTINGDVAPNRTITGATSTLSGPAGIDLDSALDRLYVSHFPGVTPAISIWHAASTADGDQAPTRSLAGPATPINSTGDVAVSR